MHTITPFLWFNTQAEEAAKFYTSIFKNSKMLGIAHYPEGSPGPVGSVMTVEFQIEGQPFIALNGGPLFTFNESISFVVSCETQKEVDHLWNALTADGGQESMCGWLKDKFGVSWQIVPTAMGKLMSGKDPKKSQRAMQAMMKMKKLDIAELERAYDGK